jgi:hypothetical protein
MQLLQMQKKAILARIRQRFPELELRDIKVRIRARPGSSPGAATSGAAPGGAPGSAPGGAPGGTPGGEQGTSQAIEQALAAVGDPGLKEKLRLLLRELEQRGGG